MTVYLLTNNVTGQRYVGATVQSMTLRMNDHRAKHKTRSYPLYRAARAYGWENFSVEEIGTAETIEQLMAMEMAAIERFNTRYPNGYNFTDGGKGTRGRLHSEATRELMREKAKQGRGGWNRGRKTGPLSAEHRAKLSASHKGQEPWNRGVPHSEDTKRKFADGRRAGGGNNQARAAIFDGVCYPSIADAMKALGLSRMQASYRLKLGRAQYAPEGTE
jgi:group I intron endonuclease